MFLKINTIKYTVVITYFNFMKQFFKSTIVVSIGTLLARITGFVRDIFMAKYLGSGFYSDVFFMAFKMPNCFRRIFAEGALTSAFVPIFASGLQLHGKQKMMVFARNIYSVLLYFLLIFVIIAEIFMPYLMYIMAPGYLENKEKFELVVMLTRITFPYLILISITSLMSGILHSLNKFFAVSLIPVVLNTVLVAAILLFRHSNELGIATVLSYAVFCAGIAQFLWILFFTLKQKAFVYPVFPRFTPTTKEFFSKFFDAFLGSGIIQINSVLDSVFATVVAGGVSLLYYGNRVSQLPLSLIGTAIGISILPVLSKTLGKNGNKEDSQEIQEDSIFFACFLGIPASVGLFILSNPIIKILFQRGQFTPENTLQVSNILKIYAISIPFSILTKIFQTVFYAKKDTKTPMKASLYSLIINTILNLILVFTIGVNGIAMATTIATITVAMFLFYKLLKDKVFIFSEDLQVRLLKILYLSIIMGIFTYCVDLFVSKYIHLIIVELIISIGFAGIIFLILSYLFNLINMKEIMKLLKKDKNNI